MRNLNRANPLPVLAACLLAICLTGTPHAEEPATPPVEEAAAASPTTAAPEAPVAAENEETTASPTTAAPEAPVTAENETTAASEGTAVSATSVEAENAIAEQPAAEDAEQPAASASESAAETETAAAPPAATILDEPAPAAEAAEKPAHPQEISIIPFKGYDLDGKRVDVGACIGEKPVLLVFWASWCPSCRAEVPHMNKLADRFGDRMAVVGVNIAENDTYKRAKAFAAKTGMRYPTIYDGSQLLAWQYAIRGLPTVVVADKKGIIRYYGPGAPDIDEAAFAKLTAD